MTRVNSLWDWRGASHMARCPGPSFVRAETCKLNAFLDKYSRLAIKQTFYYLTSESEIMFIEQRKMSPLLGKEVFQEYI